MRLGSLEIVNRTGVAVAAEHDLERLVQIVTDAGVELSHAQFGAFFYNALREDGEAYTLYTLVRRVPRILRPVPDAAQHRQSSNRLFAGGVRSAPTIF